MLDRFLSGVDRVFGSERGGVSFRILDLSSTSTQFGDPIISFPPKFSFYRESFPIEQRRSKILKYS
jgi:hypothetical protein